MFILLIVSAVGIAMILYEYSRPGRNWPAVRAWWLRATLFKFFLCGLPVSHGTAGWCGIVFFLWRGWALSVKPCSDISQLPLSFTGGTAGATLRHSFGGGFIKFTIVRNAWKSSPVSTSIRWKFCSIA